MKYGTLRMRARSAAVRYGRTTRRAWRHTQVSRPRRVSVIGSAGKLGPSEPDGSGRVGTSSDIASNPRLSDHSLRVNVSDRNGAYAEQGPTKRGQDVSAAWWQQVSIERWARGATAFMVLPVAWSLAQFTWLVLPGGVSEVGKAAPVAQVRQARTAARLAPVADLALFGRPEAMAAGAPLDAPETRLNLTLRGVLATGSQPYARAIVGAGGGEERSYRVGENLPGGATLDQVLADRVILQRAGRFEALFLPKDEGSAGASSFERSGASGDAGAAVVSPDMGSRLQDVRQRIMEDPTQAFSFARVQPVMEGGRLKGYKLSPNKEKQLFRQIGLRPGDVVTSVNGISLEDPATVGEVLGQLTTSSELVLNVDRNGRQETVVVPFQ